MILSLLYLLFATIAVILISWYLFCLKFFNKLQNVKGPVPMPLIGNAWEFTSCTATLPTFSRLFAQHGKLVKMLLGPEPMLFIADYDAIEKVLNSSRILQKSTLYRFVYNWLNLGLLTSSGSKWKQRRRILTPAYHFQILEQFVPIFDSVGKVLIQQFRNEKNKDAVDVYPYITLSTLDVICETAMGVSVNAQINQTSAYVTSVKEMGRILMDRSFRPQEQIEFLYQFTENYKTEKECLKILHGHTTSVINRRRQELQKRGDTTNDNVEDDVGSKRRMAFLDLLLQASENGQPLSDEAIREEVDTFMFEGHDTTASGISFALYEIANHPDVQRKILEEQLNVLGDEKRDVTYHDLNQMKYLDLVIKETMRLYPPVPMFGRQTTEPLDIGNGIIVPTGFNITVIVYEIHRDPEYFPNPDKFDPERFLPENNAGKLPYSFIPFSAGPRNCIGQKFAILEMKSTLSKIVRNFELFPTVPVHKLELSAETILKSANGILIKMKERV